MTEPLNEVYSKYNIELKPLVSEVEGRLEKFEEPLLKNLVAQFDYVALAVLEADSNKQELYLQQALSYLDIAVTNSYQYLIFALSKKIKIFKKHCGGWSGIAQLADGRYIGKMKTLEAKAKKAVRGGMKLDDCYACSSFKFAYECYTEQEVIMEELAVVAVAREKKSKLCTVVGWIASIVISVISGWLVHYWLN